MTGAIRTVPNDDVSVRMTSGKGSVRVRTNRPYLPVDRRNLAFAAAELMINKLGLKDRDISIDITKRIPVAAGLAGGSSNAAAVMHAVNTMTGSGVSLGEMCNLSVRLGSDVPFCLVSQARGNYRLSFFFSDFFGTNFFAETTDRKSVV